MLSVQNAFVEKNNKEILSNVSAELNESRIGIIGSNGSGKSTFAKLLNGLETPTSGQVLLENTPISSKSALGKVGFVFQNPDNQIVFPIVGEDLEFGLKKSGLAKEDIQQRVRKLVERFSITHLIDRRTHELSGGEKQLIALIGVLVMEPQIIVIDEPTTLLDLRNRRTLLNTLDQLEQNLVIVSHDLELMAQMQRLIWIEEGMIRADSKPSVVLEDYVRFSENLEC